MKVLIIGSDSQLGLQHRILANPNYNFLYFNKSDFDITNYSLTNNIIKLHKPDIIINYAAYTDVENAEVNFDLAKAINFYAVENLAKVSKYFNSHLIHLSTDYVFNPTNNMPIKEDYPKNPQTKYGVSKSLGEEAIIRVGGLYTILRISWLFSTFKKNFLKTMLHKITNNSDITVVDDQIGRPTYAGDVIYILDKLCTEISMNNISSTYHFDSGPKCSWYDFTKAILKIYLDLGFKTTSKISRISSKDINFNVPRPHFSVLNGSLLRKKLKIDQGNWEAGIKKCIAELLNT